MAGTVNGLIRVLFQMCPNHTWQLLTKPEEFNQREPRFHYVLDIEGHQYDGEARNKKAARWYAAAAACKDLFDVEYPDDIHQK